MSRTASRSLITLAAVLCLPVIAAAQATQTATPPAKPMTMAKPAAPAAKAAAATAPAPKPAAAVAATPAAAKPAATAPATAAPAAAAGPARDARGRFIAKGATPAATANHATCKDGTAWEGARRAGACSRHGGVKSWS